MKVKKNISIGLTVLMLLIASTGCSSKMRVSFVPGDRLPDLYSEQDCAIRYFRSAESFPEECAFGGTLAVRDNGFSTDCDTERVRDEIRIAACRIGANRAVLTRMNNFVSTCIQTDAELYVCPRDETGTETRVEAENEGGEAVTTFQSADPAER